MATLRRLAMSLFIAASRLVSKQDRDWRDAMLRELDAIDNDRDAASWALGSTAALVGRSPRALFSLACVAFLVHFVVHVARQL
jgi:hypothetical protein